MIMCLVPVKNLVTLEMLSPDLDPVRDLERGAQIADSSCPRLDRLNRRHRKHFSRFYRPKFDACPQNVGLFLSLSLEVFAVLIALRSLLMQMVVNTCSVWIPPRYRLARSEFSFG